MSIASVLVGLALSRHMLGANAMPATPVASPVLYEDAPRGQGVYIWVSNITDAIYGEDATNFDYQILGDTAGAIESIESFAAAYSTGDADATLVAFLNATMGGTMTAEQATNQEWLCGELSGNMASTVEACGGVTLPTAS